MDQTWHTFFRNAGATEPVWLRYQQDMKSWIFADPSSHEHMKEFTTLLAGIHVFLTSQKLYKSRPSTQDPTVPIQCLSWATRMHGLALFWLRRFQLKVLTRASSMHLINDDVQRFIQVLQDWLHNIDLMYTDALAHGWTYIPK